MVFISGRALDADTQARHRPGRSESEGPIWLAVRVVIGVKLLTVGGLETAVVSHEQGGRVVEL